MISRRAAFFLLVFLFFGGITEAKPSTPKSLDLIFDDRILKVDFSVQPELLTYVPEYSLSLSGKKIPLKANPQIFQKIPEILEVQNQFIPKISEKKLTEFFKNSAILKELKKNTVEIRKQKDEIIFEGEPSYGYDINMPFLIEMINHALDQGLSAIRVPSEKIYSQVIVDPDLKKRGIEEIIAIGESNFSGSSPERKQNILAGAKKFNGFILEKGERFSFNEILESVEEEDGFVRELVIKGDRTEKELGGGVCQVSTTAFRAAFHAGLPIKRRRNHSYAVPYYQPFGLDAAIYLGQLDLRFSNDTPGDILIQTKIEDDNIFFVFYGTNDHRKVLSEGPFISDYESAPSPKVFLTEDLPEGEIQTISSAHDGFRSEWIRTVVKGKSKQRQNFISTYKPWPAKVKQGTKKQKKS